MKGRFLTEGAQSRLNGVLLIDKPSGPTSHDIVVRVRRMFGERRCGHAGTLDPFATGLLILCLGRATRLARFLLKANKTYIATLRFGFSTDTYDRTGVPVGPANDFEPESSALKQLLTHFEGRTVQQPPAFSAKKYKGKRLYSLARSGIVVASTPVEVEMRDIQLLSLDGSIARIQMSVSSGTYIRSFAHDLGLKLGQGAHLVELRRTHIGSFSLADCFSLDNNHLTSVDKVLLDANEALRDLPPVYLGDQASVRLTHGRAPSWDELTSGKLSPDMGPVRVLSETGELVAVGNPDPVNRSIRPLIVWAAGR